MISAQIPMCLEDEQERKRKKIVQKRGRKRSVKCFEVMGTRPNLVIKVVCI